MPPRTSATPIPLLVPSYEVSQEAQRLLALPLARARAEFGDRVARAFLLNEPSQLSEFWQALAFNADLATELRLRAAAKGVSTLWDAA